MGRVVPRTMASLHIGLFPPPPFPIHFSCPLEPLPRSDRPIPKVWDNPCRYQLLSIPVAHATSLSWNRCIGCMTVMVTLRVSKAAASFRCSQRSIRFHFNQRSMNFRGMNMVSLAPKFKGRDAGLSAFSCITASQTLQPKLQPPTRQSVLDGYHTYHPGASLPPRGNILYLSHRSSIGSKSSASLNALLQGFGHGHTCSITSFLLKT